MDENRKETIMKEIMYWKEHRLLPDRYCDYLLALYSGGEEVAATPASGSRMQPKKNYFRYAVLILAAAGNLLLHYFTQIPSPMQIGIGGLSVILLGAAVYAWRQKAVLFHTAITVLALVFVLMTVRGAALFSGGSEAAVFGALSGNCLLWIWAGRRFSLPYFFLAGLLGIVVMIYFLGNIFNIY